MLINNGEDTRHQFQRDFSHVDGLAAELVAFDNTAGGTLLLGVTDSGQIEGLDADDIRRLNQMLSDAASQHIEPPYDREERISPGHLPNHLDTEQIRFGLSNLRNPALASHAFHLLPYRGLESGIPRVIAAWECGAPCWQRK